MRFPIFIRQSDSCSMRRILRLKLIGSSGFWCAGLTAQPTEEVDVRRFFKQKPRDAACSVARAPALVIAVVVEIVFRVLQRG